MKKSLKDNSQHLVKPSEKFKEHVILKILFDSKMIQIYGCRPKDFINNPNIMSGKKK